MKNGQVGTFCLGIWRKINESNLEIYYYKTHSICIRPSATYGERTFEPNIPPFVKKDYVIGVDLQNTNSISGTSNVNFGLKMYKVRKI